MDREEILADLRKLQRATRAVRVSSRAMSAAFEHARQQPGQASTDALHETHLRHAEAVHGLSLLLELLAAKRSPHEAQAVPVETDA